MTHIPLSALHSIEIAEPLRHLLVEPQGRDFPLISIARKTGPDGRELVHMELVIAGRQTRESCPLAERYPVHFLKSYHPWSFHGDPAVEFENTRVAAEILGAPEPIGFTSNSFRTAFIPGKALSKLSPFTNVEPAERCLGIAQQTDPAALIGLWKLAEEAFAQVEKLHAHHFFHRDLELHNIIVSTAPIQVFLIDYESSERAFEGPEEHRRELRFKDLAELLRLAIFLQSGLGHQDGPLAAASLEALPRLFRSTSTFASRLEAADRRAVAGGTAE
jgi:hypothetical protein